MRSAVLALFVLSGCATARVEPVEQRAPTAIVPAAMADLRGRELLGFVGVDLPTSVARIEDFTTRCFAAENLRRIDEPHGFALIGRPGEPYLRAMFAESATVSSSVALDGYGLTPALQEALAASVQGRPRCPA